MILFIRLDIFVSNILFKVTFNHKHKHSTLSVLCKAAVWMTAVGTYTPQMAYNLDKSQPEYLTVRSLGPNQKTQQTLSNHTVMGQWVDLHPGSTESTGWESG